MVDVFLRFLVNWLMYFLLEVLGWQYEYKWMDFYFVLDDFIGFLQFWGGCINIVVFFCSKYIFFIKVFIIFKNGIFFWKNV